jgi:hypothetical protein
MPAASFPTYVKSGKAFYFSLKFAYVSMACKGLLAQALQMHALPWASGGNLASRSALKSTPTHQHGPGSTPVTRSISMPH